MCDINFEENLQFYYSLNVISLLSAYVVPTILSIESVANTMKINDKFNKSPKQCLIIILIEY